MDNALQNQNLSSSNDLNDTLSQSQVNQPREGNSSHMIFFYRKMSKLLIIIFLVVLVIFGLWQYFLHQRLFSTNISCGGDWSYMVKCSLGSYCQSLGQGPLAGGLCKAWLSSVFERFGGQKQKDQISPLTREPTPTPSVNRLEEQGNLTNWKEFSGSDFDITFKCPDDWVVETGYVLGGQSDFECSMISGWLKNPSSCKGTHKSPEVNVRPSSTKNISPQVTENKGLLLWGPTEGLGGACPDCEVVNRSAVVAGKSYTIPVKIHPSGRYSTFPSGGVIIELSGDSSIWSQIDVEFDITSKDDYETILKILSTIKPN